MNYRLPFLCLLSIAPFFVKAQASAQLNAAEIRQGLAALNVTGSVLYIAAHPDDENTRLLTYLSKEKKVRTGYLSLTRGDGGQNLIGTEQGDLLGLIRTQELLAARRTDGAEQFFSRANDFGFSKTSEESFKIWGKEQILSDVVWVIRNFQPDVIITRFPEDARAGHGHHQASAILAREAFAAAADPKRFPEQLKFVKIWKTKRIVWNTFNFGGANTTSDDQIKLDVGVFNPLLGKSYGEIAAESRSNHKSQGFGSALQRGSAIEFFSPVAGDAAQKDLFEGLDFKLDRNKGTEKAQQMLNAINAAYDAAAPAKSIPALLQLKEEVKNLPFKHQQLDELILACAGIWMETTTPEPAYALDDSVPVLVSVISRVGAGFPMKITLQDLSRGKVSDLNPNQMATQTVILSARSIGITQPYWLKQTHPTGSYLIDSLNHLGMPEAPAPSAGVYRISFGKQFIDITRPIVYKHTDPVKGELYQPLVIAPPVTATMTEKSFLFSNNTPKKITVQLKSFKEGLKGLISPQVPAGWKVSPEKVEIDLPAKGTVKNLEFIITPAGTVSSGKLSIWAAVDGKTYNQGLKVLSYDHIPVQTLFPFAEAKVERADLKFAGMNIGYIAGAGDLIPESLTQIGYHVTWLTEKQVIDGDLSAYDAIITGVRLYNISDQISAMQPKLMEYVKNGGTMLVQYNVNGTLKFNDIGPYPFRLTRDRVTDEDAKVSFLAPNDAALNFPNKITAKDFDGWIQERGLYFAGDIDSHYVPVLGMNDIGEPSGNGSLLVAPFGKGKFVYTSLAFFRELPAGVPGAYRLFVNLISKN
ncbi:N-acetylglucosaminyl deacetylase, LmbE family [Pedobacter westerhofensis]|uniref:N-acetylglucosaminyl deacetylase, LmbE family n=1 Tax=Pedobacter westerhofensis TaxID=425512 RepID=A0A521EUL7_9SPHI|nr:PIG-L family deacetylase [Pedobacter westerhofensis]SMO87623.1 N-acetylglucosaminyl deacetylase, LmbE family [Pedobacter westerhofensis]